MALDLKKLLIEDFGFDEAEATALAPKIKPEKVAHLEQSIGIRAANVAAAAELETARQQLTEANNRLNDEMAEWATLTQREKAEATELRTRLEAAEVVATQLRMRATELAKAAGVDPKTALEGTAVVPERKPDAAPAAPDMSQYVRTDQFGNAIRFNVHLPAQLAYIAEEHRELTGQRLDTREITKLIEENASKKGGIIDPVAIWEAKYGIPEKRQQAAEKKQAEVIAAAEARGEERARSAAALPNATPTGRHAPVFGSRNDQGQFTPRTSALNRPQPGGTVAAAAAAIRSGKYRVAPTRRAGQSA